MENDSFNSKSETRTLLGRLYFGCQIHLIAHSISNGLTSSKLSQCRRTKEKSESVQCPKTPGTLALKGIFIPGQGQSSLGTGYGHSLRLSFFLYLSFSFFLSPSRAKFLSFLFIPSSAPFFSSHQSKWHYNLIRFTCLFVRSNWLNPIDFSFGALER